MELGTSKQECDDIDCWLDGPSGAGNQVDWKELDEIEMVEEEDEEEGEQDTLCWIGFLYRS